MNPHDRLELLLKLVVPLLSDSDDLKSLSLAFRSAADAVRPHLFRAIKTIHARDDPETDPWWIFCQRLSDESRDIPRYVR